MLGEVQFFAVLLDIVLESVRVFIASKFPDALGHFFEITCGVNMTSSPKHKAVHRIKWHQSEFFVGVSANGLEDFFDHFRVVKECWSPVECVSVFFEQSCASTNSVCLFEDGGSRLSEPEEVQKQVHLVLSRRGVRLVRWC